MGKTSLLKQVEYELDRLNPPGIGLYFSLEGVNTPEAFKTMLEHACQGKSELLSNIGFKVEEVFGETKDVQDILWKLNDILKESKSRLFLLLDEAENLTEFEPSFLQSLRFSFQEADKIHPILAASQNIYKINEKMANLLTSPFFDHFHIERLRPLDKQAAEDLIKQTQSEHQFDVDNETIARIQELTGNHPQLIQCLCYKIFETTGGITSVTEYHLETAYGEITQKPNNYIEQSYKPLLSIQKQIVVHVSKSELLKLGDIRKQIDTSLDEDALKADLDELSDLGYLKEESGKYSISNYFHRRWLKENRQRLEYDASERLGKGRTTTSDLVVNLVIPSIGVFLMIVIAMGAYATLSGIERIIVMVLSSVMGFASFAKLLISNIFSREKD